MQPWVSPDCSTSGGQEDLGQSRWTACRWVPGLPSGSSRPPSDCISSTHLRTPPRTGRPPACASWWCPCAPSPTCRSWGTRHRQWACCAWGPGSGEWWWARRPQWSGDGPARPVCWSGSLRRRRAEETGTAFSQRADRVPQLRRPAVCWALTQSGPSEEPPSTQDPGRRKSLTLCCSVKSSTHLTATCLVLCNQPEHTGNVHEVFPDWPTQSHSWAPVFSSPVLLLCAVLTSGWWFLVYLLGYCLSPLGGLGVCKPCPNWKDMGRRNTHLGQCWWLR